eukprot:TRINITY_DN14896_c0_g1_i5.p1 TRINITY_DN14896_c0_g1~~TRINITY_DN14896_c0_g1_i5.p1  ORF type:complete len:144 (+),score=39.91 TRINITY_DN14896_c0_g1_i5:133-564(+)
MIRRPPRSTQGVSSAASDVYKRQINAEYMGHKLNLSFFLAAIFIMYTTFLEKQRIMYIIMGDIYKKLTRLKRYGYIENKNISVYYKKGLVNVLALVDKNKFNTFYVLDDNMKLIKTIHEDELIEALKEHGNITLEEYIKKNEQ